MNKWFSFDLCIDLIDVQYKAIHKLDMTAVAVYNKIVNNFILKILLFSVDRKFSLRICLKTI